MPRKTSYPKNFMMWAVTATAYNTTIVYGLWLTHEKAQKWVNERKTTLTTYNIVTYYPREMVNARVARSTKRR